tara:strand:- start:59 stop:394 length:336 start_codon:yes stop_codon:yes gene_type:complete
MVIPGVAFGGLGAAVSSDKGKKFLKGFADTLTGGLTDFDKQGDNRLQEFQKNQMKRNMRAAGGLIDFATGGLTDFDQQGDSRMQEMGKQIMFGGARGVVPTLGAVQNQFMG